MPTKYDNGGHGWHTNDARIAIYNFILVQYDSIQILDIIYNSSLGTNPFYIFE